MVMITEANPITISQVDPSAVLYVSYEVAGGDLQGEIVWLKEGSKLNSHALKLDHKQSGTWLSGKREIDTED